MERRDFRPWTLEIPCWILDIQSFREAKGVRLWKKACPIAFYTIPSFLVFQPILAFPVILVGVYT